MPKKFTILSTLTLLASSTLGALVPAIANGASLEYHYADEIVPINTAYAADMRAECGAYNDSMDYFRCRSAMDDRYSDRYGSVAFNSSTQLSLNAKMAVTALNSDAGALRFYIDETSRFTGPAYQFKNLAIFWVESSVTPNPAYDDDVAWEVADAILNGDPVQKGVHILYQSDQDSPDWFTPNAENRILFDEADDPASEANFSRSIFLYGYDTNNERHRDRSHFTECSPAGGSECRFYFSYDLDRSTFSYGYNLMPATAEDTSLAELNRAIRAAKAAEQAAAEAASIAENAKVAAEAADARAAAAENLAFAADQAAAEALDNAAAAEERAEAAEEKAKAAEARAKIAEKSAADAEKEVAEARKALEEAQKLADEAAKVAEEALKTVAETRKIAENAATVAETASKAAENASMTANETRKLYDDLSARVASLSEKLSALASTVDNLNITPVNNYITYQTITNQTGNDAEVTSVTTETAPLATTDADYVELPLAGNEKTNNFPWWIVVITAFATSGLALGIWWILPKKSSKFKK